jgi:hypothetical protein
MRWAIEAYERLKRAERDRPDQHVIEAMKREEERAAMNARIRRRLPKVI